MEAFVNRLCSEETLFTARHLMLFWQMSEMTRTFDKGTFCCFAAEDGVKEAVEQCHVSPDVVVKLANVLISKKQLEPVKRDQPFEANSSAVFSFTNRPPSVAEHCPAFPNVLPYTKTSGWLLFSGIKPKEFARQLTLYEHEMFRAIRLSELTNVVWQDEKLRDEKAAHVVAFSDFSNKVSTWAATEIVLTSDLELRVSALTRMIQLADECLQLQNFNAFLEIMIGLMHSSVARLKQTWAALSSSAMAQFTRLKDLANPLPNYAKYRAVLQQASLPMIPSLSVVLIDLVQIDLCSKMKKSKAQKAAAAAAAAAAPATVNAQTPKSPLARSPFSTLAAPPPKPTEQKASSSAAAAPSVPSAVADAENEVDMQRLTLHSTIFHSILDVKGCFYTFKRVEPIINYLSHLFAVPEESLMNYSRTCESDEAQQPSGAKKAKTASHILV